MNKINVFIVINDFLVGGAQRLISAQLKYADYERYEFHVITLFDFPNRKNLYEQIPFGVPVHRISMKSTLDIFGFLKFARICIKYKPDIVFSHLFFSNIVTRLFKVFLGYKVYTVDHNTYINKKKWHIFLDNILSFFSEKIIAVSEEVRIFSIKQHNIREDKFITIPNGIDIETIDNFKESVSKEQARFFLDIPIDNKLFISVGRLTTQKNQKLLIDSFASFLKRKQGKNFLYILGEGELRDQLQYQIDGLGVSDSVKLIGSTDKIFYYYRASDFFISTSLIEGMSMAYLESLAFGLPLISTRTGGTSSLLQDGINGFFIDSNSIIDVLEKISTTDYSSFSEKAYSVSLLYEIKKNINSYFKLINQFK